MTRRRADKLDPRSREARAANGFGRLELELPTASVTKITNYARKNKESRNALLSRIVHNWLHDADNGEIPIGPPSVRDPF